MKRILILLALAWSLPAADPVIGGVGFKSGFVTTSDGVKLHYLEDGRGPAILFVPGWTGAAEFWTPQMRLLSGAYRVVAMDPRSQGNSEKTNEGNYTERRARDVHEVIEKLGLGPVVLVAWSRAVPESLSLVDQFGTESLRALVLVDGTLTREVNAELARRLQEDARVMLVDRKKYVAEQVPGMFRREHAQSLYDQVAAANLKTPTPVAIALQVDSLGRDSRAVLSRVDKPTLFINRAGPGAAALAEMVKGEMPAARLEVMEDVGHAVFLDDPERFNDLLQSFLRSLASRP